MAAQIGRFSTRPQRKMIKSFSEQIGGSAHQPAVATVTERESGSRTTLACLRVPWPVSGHNRASPGVGP